jgi:hypothetical protein
VSIGTGALLDSPPWLGVVGVPVGLALLGLALAGRVRPCGVAAAFGTVIALVAVMSLNEASMLATIALGLALAAGLVVVGVRAHQVAVVVLSALGGWQYLQALVAQYLHGPLGSLLLLGSGLAVLVGALLWLRHRSGGLGTSGPATGAPGAASPA